MNVKDNQRSRLTRMLLKNAYIKLMREKPVSAISVKEICAGAEVNRSTFYLYYREPNDILMELEDETIAQVKASLYSIGTSGETSPDARGYLLSFLKDIRRNDDLLRPLLADNSDPHFRRKLQNVALELTEASFDIELSPEIGFQAYLFLVSGSIQLLEDWIRSDYTLPEQTMCDLLYKLCEGSLKNVC